ncbi:MAG: 2Fe-2S iron-sulfur cluster binding domain-containing protein [Betaproteobacteria bacterium]|nr:2Fe-2S iron-sulfur cluster binding domain-containing protein [Betaproteobacteria bacterium]
MSRLLPLSRAARLAGTTRVTLQLKIRSGELPSFDGMVSADDLLRLYPDIRLEEDGGFEQVMQIKERAFGKRVRERLLPSQEILSQRLYEQSAELADLRAHLQRYHAMMEAVRDRIREREAQPDMAALGEFLDAQLAEILGATAPNTLDVMDDMLRVMSAHVTLRPSGHDFFVEGADTLLESALKAGLAVNYGCSNGNCGLCKARVVSGEVRKVRPHDYVLSEAEKDLGYTLLCCHAAVSDLVVEALETGSAGDIPQQQIVARVKALQPLGDDMRLLHLQTPRNNRLRFLAGQSVTLTAGGASTQLSVASCPCDDRNLHFHVARDAQDDFARQVYDVLGPGDAVTVLGPWGEFVLRADSPRPILFVASEAGFAPIKGLVEHAMSLDRAERLHLYWHACGPSGHYLANLCRSWAEALDNFRYAAITAGDAQAVVDRLAQDHADLAAFDIYLAGPEAFVDGAVKALALQGFPAAQLVATAT